MRRARIRATRAARSMLAASGDLDVGYGLERGSVVELAFYQAAVDGGLREFGSASWPFDGDVAEHGEVLAQDGGARCFRLGDAVVYLGVGGGWFYMRVASARKADLQTVVAEFARLYPALFDDSPNHAGTVPVTFWTYGQFGPSSRMRRIDATAWEGVAANYPSDVRGELERLMGDSFEPGAGGQLILWQGPPGTGKTWALRALAAEWRSWAEFHYITDPDAFFVTNPDYMIDVLLADSFEALVESTDPGGEPEVATVDRQGKWRVLVLEDTGELLAANAKEQQGQGLSRLLNVVDGMVGQGLRVLALVTTNDELGDLHPAVKRPGRCASSLEFGPFPPAEANVWLASTGSRAETDEPLTLAELYALGHVEPDDEAAAELRAAASGGLVSAATALVAGAVVADSEKGREIGAVAERHAPDGGYGETAWNAGDGHVLWISADWSTNDEIQAAMDDFMAVDGVQSVEDCAECSMPEGDEWEIVYRSGASGADSEAALDAVVGLAHRPLTEDL